MKSLARNPDERYASAQEMRAALEALIRTSGWESDTLALSTWMRELFAGKLRAQAADVAAAGLASLEDFLLTVEEKTSISWMATAAPGGGEKKTPSTGLPPSRPVSGPHAPTPLPSSLAALYDDGQTVELGKGTKDAPPGNPDRVPRSSPVATTLKGGDPVPPLPPSAGVMIPSSAPLKATPTAATAGVIIPDAPASSDTPSMNVAPADNPLPQLLGATSPMPVWTANNDQSTAKRGAILGNLPSPMRRVLVAGGAALLVAAVALTIAFWPSKDSGGTGSIGGAATGGAVGSAVGGATTPTGGARHRRGARPRPAAARRRRGAPSSRATPRSSSASTRRRRSPSTVRRSRWARARRCTCSRASSTSSRCSGRGTACAGCTSRRWRRARTCRSSFRFASRRLRGRLARGLARRSRILFFPLRGEGVARRAPAEDEADDDADDQHRRDVDEVRGRRHRQPRAASFFLSSSTSSSRRRARRATDATHTTTAAQMKP